MNAIELEGRLASLEAIYSVYLSWAALAVGILTLVVVICGFFSFLWIRSEAKRVAKATAKDEARRIAEKAANHYVQNNLDAIIRSNVGMFDNISSLEEDEGDGLASHVD